MNNKLSIEETFNEDLNEELLLLKEENGVPIENQLKYSLASLIDEAKWLEQFLPEFRNKLQAIQVLAKDTYYRNFGESPID